MTADQAPADRGGGGAGGPLLDMEIKNFGPISSALISVRPLTVFIGPNNSGKSYAAKLLHSAMGAQGRFFRSTASNRDVLAACRRAIDRIGIFTGENTRIDGPRLRRIVKAVEQGVGSELRRSVERNFESPAADLVRSGQGKASLKISAAGFDQPTQLRVAMSAEGDLTVATGFKGRGYQIEEEALPGLYKILSITEAGGEKHGQSPPVDHAGPQATHVPAAHRQPEEVDTHALALSAALAEKIALHMAPRAAYREWHYLPAGRLNMLQACEALAAGIVERAADRHGGGPGVPGVSGTAADFMAGIIRMDTARGPLYDIGSRIEREIMSGSVHVSPAAPGGVPSIECRLGGRRMRLSRASSSVSAVAPLSLYLKHVVGPDSVMVVEEPEVHLHPGNEVVLAKHIVRLVRRGVCVLLTTHSPYLLEKLSKYMMAHRLAPKDRVDGLGYGKGDYLRPDEVSAYLFKKAVNGGGYRAEEIDKDDDEYGISQEEFVRVDTALHKESVFMHYRDGRE